MKNETLCLHAGYTPENGGPRVMPIYQSTTFRFNSTDEIGAVFNDPTKAHIYSRFTNPTVDCVEKKIAPPFSQISCIVFFRTTAACGSNPTKGSSKISNLGSCTNAEIIASFCFIPWE